MKRLILFLFILFYTATAWAIPTAYYCTGLTGGTASSLDSIDGTDLADLDMAVVTTLSITYVYSLDDDSAAAESSPGIIKPDANAGDKRWILVLEKSTDDTLAGDADDAVPTEQAVKAYVDSGTVTMTNKTIDANATGNTIKGYGYIQLIGPHLVGAAVNAGIDTTDTNEYYGQAQFADDVETNNYIEYRLQVPSDIDTTVDLYAWFKFRLAGADVNDHDYIIATVSVADSGDYTGTVANAVNLAYTADGSGADGDVETASGTLTAWKSNLTANSLWVIRITRDGDDGANDSSVVDSYSGPLTIRYGYTQ